VCDFPWGPGDGRQQAQGASEPAVGKTQHIEKLGPGWIGWQGWDWRCLHPAFALHCAFVYVFACLCLRACSIA
jgi:hypothetical protein